MKLIQNLNVVPWKAKHPLGPKDSYRLFADQIELSNCIEHADWRTDPIWPHVCEECWQAGCAGHGYAHAVRVNSDLLLMKPFYNIAYPHGFERDLFPEDAIEENLLIFGQTWNRVADDHPNLPSIQEFPAITNLQLHKLWLQEMPQFLKNSLEIDAEGPIKQMKKSCIAGDPFDFDQIQDQLFQMLTSIPSDTTAVQGEFQPLKSIHDPVQTFYFNEPKIPEWKAFLANNSNDLIFDNEIVFLSGRMKTMF